MSAELKKFYKSGAKKNFNWKDLYEIEDLKSAFMEQLPDHKFKNIKFISDENNTDDMSSQTILFECDNVFIGLKMTDDIIWYVVDRIKLSSTNVECFSSDDDDPTDDSFVELFDKSDSSVSYDLYPLKQGFEINYKQIDKKYQNVTEITSTELSTIEIKNKILEKQINKHMKNIKKYHSVTNYQKFDICDNFNVCIGNDMIIVLKNNEIISGFFDKVTSFQKGDYMSIAYLAECGDFVYCNYGDVSSIIIIKIEK